MSCHWTECSSVLEETARGVTNNDLIGRGTMLPGADELQDIPTARLISLPATHSRRENSR